MHIARCLLLSGLAWILAANAETAPSVPAKQNGASETSAAYPDRSSLDASVARGGIEFQHYCALCHGKTGEGNGRAAKLYNPRPANLTVSDKNPVYKGLIVRQGGAALGRSAAMPPWKEELTEEQITDIVNFLQSIVVPTTAQPGPVPASAALDTPTPASPAQVSPAQSSPARTGLAPVNRAP